MGGTCSTYGGEDRCMQGMVEKLKGKRPLGSLRRGWDDNIKIDLQVVGCGAVEWIELAQDRDRCRVIVTAVISLRVA
jgi:hypothetical protein